MRYATDLRSAGGEGMKPSAVATSYLVTIAVVAGAWLARWLLDPLLGDHLPFVTFFVAVIVAAWICGFRSAMLAMALGFLLALYFFVPPRFSFFGSSGPHLVGLAMYFMVSFAIAVFGEGMRSSQRRLREIINAIPAAIYTTDAKGRLTHFNPAAVEFSGRVPELGTDHWCVSWKLYRPDGTPMPHEECPMAIALKEGRIVRGAEAIAERPDGKRLWFTPYPTPLLDAEGRVVAASTCWWTKPSASRRMRHCARVKSVFARW